MSGFDPKSLTEERNLWDIYLKSRRIPVSRFNQIATITVFCLLIGYVLVGQFDAATIAQKTKVIAAIGFTFSTSILGFLIAGFTIFATISKPELFMKLAQVKEDKSGLSYLKYTFFGLMKVFIFYLAFAVLTFFIQAFYEVSANISALIHRVSEEPFFVVLSLSALIFVGTATWFFHLFMLLQSFIFNIHNAVMMSVQWEFYKPKSTPNRRCHSETPDSPGSAEA